MGADGQADRFNRVARALADPTRRRLLECLAERPGLTTGELGAGVRHLTRWAVLKHLTVLRDARLIETLPESRQRRHYLNVAALDDLSTWLQSLRSRRTRGEPPD
jgi:DNA-binding transcriptional ArsR family regulator